MEITAPSSAVPRASLLGLLAIFGFVGAIRAASLLSNPGFEYEPAGPNQIPGWQSYGTNDYVLTGSSSAQAHGGSNYFKVYQAFTGVVNYDGVYQDFIAGPGAVYSVDGWAYTASSDTIAGQNVAWLEVSFRDSTVTNILALYRSALITTNAIASGAFPRDQWNHLLVTNQYDPVSFQLTNTVTALAAPPGALIVRCQIVFQGDANYSGGSVYFDDINLQQTAGAPYGNMNIVWSDEFNGSNINKSIWTNDVGGGGWGNQELEDYTTNSANSYVSNGLLHIVARQQSGGGENYTSARMLSQGFFSFTYGRLEWRARAPEGVGFWPALWMMGTNIATIGWPNCGEVDVLECNGSSNTMVQGSLHYGGNPTAKYFLIDGTTITNFHTYTLDWTTNAFLFYVDGHFYEQQTNWSDSYGPYPFPFNQPFFLLMNFAIGGNYVGNPSTNQINAGSVFPAEMQVDYVRIYRATDPLQLSIKNLGASIELTWPSNIVCQLQEKADLSQTGSAGSWSSVGTPTNSLRVVPSGSAFYRLISP